MVTMPSFSEIAPTGQTSAHSRHFLHFSVITFTVFPTIIITPANSTSHAENVQWIMTYDVICNFRKLEH